MKAEIAFANYVKFTWIVKPLQFQKPMQWTVKERYGKSEIENKIGKRALFN